jgi:hypothetical protein
MVSVECGTIAVDALPRHPAAGHAEPPTPITMNRSPSRSRGGTGRSVRPSPRTARPPGGAEDQAGLNLWTAAWGPEQREDPNCICIQENFHLMREREETSGDGGNGRSLDPAAGPIHGATAWHLRDWPKRDRSREELNGAGGWPPSVAPTAMGKGVS